MVGTEVDPHSWNGPDKWLGEQMYEGQVSKKEILVLDTHKIELWACGRRIKEGILTGDIPFHSPSSLSVFTTLKTMVTIPTLPVLKEEKSIHISRQKG